VAAVLSTMFVWSTLDPAISPRSQRLFR